MANSDLSFFLLYFQVYNAHAREYIKKMLKIHSRISTGWIFDIVRGQWEFYSYFLSQHITCFKRILGKIIFLHRNTTCLFWYNAQILWAFCARTGKATMHHQCNITCLWLSTSSASPNHETSLCSPTNQISICGCSHAKKERGRPMRNEPPPSPCILHTRQSPSEKCQRTGNQSL